MKLKEILNLAPNQDEYIVKHKKAKIMFNNPDDVPEVFENMEVSSIYGYDAEGYDGLQINLVD